MYLPNLQSFLRFQNWLISCDDFHRFSATNGDHPSPLPIAGPFNPPHTGEWHNVESEFSAPDISGWSPQQIGVYFSQIGFPPEVSKVFVEQVSKEY
jgi:hypothetical protein